MSGASNEILYDLYTDASFMYNWLMLKWKWEHEHWADKNGSWCKKAHLISGEEIFGNNTLITLINTISVSCQHNLNNCANLKTLPANYLPKTDTIAGNKTG